MYTPKNGPYTASCAYFCIFGRQEYLRFVKGPGTALIETEPFQVYTNEKHS